MTKHECAVITAYTDISMLKGNDLKYLYDYLSGFVGRPIYSHEIPAVCTQFREQIREDFIAMCRNAKEADDTADYHALTLTLRSLLFAQREGVI